MTDNLVPIPASPFPILVIACLLFSAAVPSESIAADRTASCLDGFCIGQSINDPHFDNVDWLVPKKGITKQACNGVGCQPGVAFRGYPPDEQVKLAEAVSWIYGSPPYNIVTRGNLGIFRQYRYECNLSARDIFGERRFWGAYKSIPSHYLTVVGLRLIDGELRVYRIARQYPFHNQGELQSLAQQLYGQYGDRVLFVNYLSSNAYPDVIAQKKDGWFGRSTMFNPTDLADNEAELVLIDRKTRHLLEASSMPESGEIKPLAISPAAQCRRSMPVQ